MAYLILIIVYVILNIIQNEMHGIIKISPAICEALIKHFMLLKACTHKHPLKPQ